MAIRAAELQVVIEADTSPATSGIRNAMSMIKQSVSSSLGVISGMLAVQAVGTLENLVVAGISAVGEFERLELTLKALVSRDLRDAGQSLDLVGIKTKELIRWTQHLAKESPFDLSGIVAALRTAMAYGFTADEAKRLTKATLDFVAGSGLSVEAMDQITLALGQIRAKGKLAGQEMLQLVNAGIDVRDALSRYFGVTVQEVSEKIEEGAIDANTAVEAIVSALEEDFGGASKEQANTVSGLLSTLGEIKKVGLAEFFRSALDALKPLVSQFIEWAQGPGMEFIKNFGAYFAEFAIKIVVFGQSFVEYFQPILGWIAENGKTIRGALMGIAIAFGAMAVISSVASLVAMLANPLTIIIALAGLLGAAWANNWGSIHEKTAAIWTWLQPIFEAIKSWLQINIPRAFDWLKEKWQQTWNTVEAVFAVVWPIIQNIWNAFKAAFQGDWYQFGEHLRQAWDAIWRTQVEIFQNVRETLTSLVRNLLERIINFFTTIDWGAVGKNILVGIAEGIKNGSQWLIETVANVVKAAVDAVRGFLGIHSPSELFRDEIGMNIMRGWIEGIKKMQPKLQSAVTAMAEVTVVNTVATRQRQAGIVLRNYGTLIVHQDNPFGTSLLSVLR